MHSFSHPFRALAAVILVVFSLTVLPLQGLSAAMIGTERLIQSEVQQTRQKLQSLLQREEVRQTLHKHGISPSEASARVAGLTDSEVRSIAGRLDKLPAGEGALGTIIGAAVFIFIVLLITDILGFTDVFSFVVKNPR